MIAHYKVTAPTTPNKNKSNNLQQVDQASFSQADLNRLAKGTDGTFHPHIACHNCGKKGHYRTNVQPQEEHPMPILAMMMVTMEMILTTGIKDQVEAMMTPMIKMVILIALIKVQAMMQVEGWSRAHNKVVDQQQIEDAKWQVSVE